MPSSPLALQEVQSAARAAWRFGSDYSLADPHFLALIPLGLLAFAWGRARRGRAVGRVPLLVGGLPRTQRQRWSFLAPLFHIAALVLVSVALARPLRGNVESSVTSEGVDIVLAVDRSTSMRYDDLEEGRTRLDVVKDVVGEFAERRMNDREDAADSVALLPFARFPELVCPFTLDVDALQGFLEKVELVEHKAEDSTAIGVALAKAVAVLRGSEAKSKIVVLLTDGENNVDDILPDQAAELAAEEGVRVYTIFAARWVYQQQLNGFEMRMVPTREEPDTTELRKIAELTGGRFYRARDKESLQEIYAEIEELERTPRTETRWEETYDLYPRFLLAALGAYMVAWLSSAECSFTTGAVFDISGGRATY